MTKEELISWCIKEDSYNEAFLNRMPKFSKKEILEHFEEFPPWVKK